MILFYALKCVTEEEDVELLNFTSKIVPFGAGYDDGDMPSSLSPHNGDSRKRKQVFQDIAREQKVRNKNITDLVQTVKEFMSSAKKAPEKNELSGDIQNIDTVVKLTKQLNELRELNEKDELTMLSIRITEAALRRAQTQCDKFLD